MKYKNQVEIVKMKYIIVITLLVLAFADSTAQQSDRSAVKLARVKYSGGGDWYNDPSAEVNLLDFVKKNTNINVEAKYTYVDLAEDNLFVYPMIFLTGHGNINFSDREVRILRAYLDNGGFLYIDDDYGLDEFIRREMKKVYPELDFIELPFSHKIYNCHFVFNSGMPKIHEHDDKVPRGYGLIQNGRLSVFYTVETNPSDGWADPEVHNNPPEKREAALKIGTNIIVYALTN